MGAEGLIGVRSFLRLPTAFFVLVTGVVWPY